MMFGGVSALYRTRNSDRPVGVIRMLPLFVAAPALTILGPARSPEEAFDLPFEGCHGDAPLFG